MKREKMNYAEFGYNSLKSLKYLILPIPFLLIGSLIYGFTTPFLDAIQFRQTEEKNPNGGK